MKNEYEEQFRKDFADFWSALIECACWSSGNEEGEASPPVGLDEEILKAHALSFFSRMHFYIKHEKGDKTVKDAGHDFWLTSQGHGAGFRDGGWPIYGAAFTRIAHCYTDDMDKHLSYESGNKD